MAKRLLSVLVALALVVGLMPAVGATEVATEFSDMPDNWARKALESAVANGLLQGYDGKIMPDAPLTRAQMAAIVVRAFGATEEGDISSYTDVGNKWYKSDIAKAYKMGVMQGYAGKMNPESNITREQAFTILARALKLDPATSISKQFEDVDEISDFAKGAIYALVNAGYVQGSNNRLYPKNTITRAEFAQVMYNLIQQYINREGEYAEVANGNVMINVPNVTLKGVTVDGDLIIGDGVGGGDITLEDVIVTGRMVVRGGGQNSIIIRGKSSVSNVVAAKVDGAVRVKVEGDAEVEIIIVDDGSDDIIIEGNVGSVEVKSDVTVTISNANIGSVKVAENAEAAKIVVSADSKVENVEVQAQNAEINVEGTVNNVSTSAANTVVTGKGTVKKVEVKKGADGTKVETPKTQITVDEGVTGVTAGGGKEVEGGKTVTNNDDGSDVVTPPTGGGTYTPPVPEVETATFKPVDSIGIHDGKVYEGYKLMAGEDQIDLVASNIESMTVLEPGATEPKTLTVGDDSDPLLWFNVQNATGDYKYTVKTKVGKVYEATIEWTAPVTVNAEATGAEGKHDGNYYVEYKLGNLDLSSFTKMYQIKPNGEVFELTANTDSNLWFKTNGQVEGDHVFLVKQGETWYTATITYSEEEEQSDETETEATTEEPTENEAETDVHEEVEDVIDGEESEVETEESSEEALVEDNVEEVEAEEPVIETEVEDVEEEQVETETYMEDPDDIQEDEEDVDEEKEVA